MSNGTFRVQLSYNRPINHSNEEIGNVCKLELYSVGIGLSRYTGAAGMGGQTMSTWAGICFSLW